MCHIFCGSFNKNLQEPTFFDLNLRPSIKLEWELFEGEDVNETFFKEFQFQFCRFIDYKHIMSIYSNYDTLTMFLYYTGDTAYTSSFASQRILTKDH